MADRVDVRRRRTCARFTLKSLERLFDILLLVNIIDISVLLLDRPEKPWVSQHTATRPLSLRFLEAHNPPLHSAGNAKIGCKSRVADHTGGDVQAKALVAHRPDGKPICNSCSGAGLRARHNVSTMTGQKPRAGRCRPVKKKIGFLLTRLCTGRSRRSECRLLLAEVSRTAERSSRINHGRCFSNRSGNLSRERASFTNNAASTC